MMPDSFFEVEHSTDIQNSLCKFADLQSFNAQMFIVADARRHDEFIAKLSHDYFKPISDRVKFVSYDKLDRYYEGLMMQRKSSRLFSDGRIGLSILSINRSGICIY